MAGSPGTTVIREWRHADAAALARLADDREVWLGLRDLFPHPYGIGDALGFIALAGRIDPRTFFAIEVDGDLAGGIGYIRRTDVERIGAEVGYWLGRPFRGRGIATAALRLLTAHAFAADPELRRLWAVPFAPTSRRRACSRSAATGSKARCARARSRTASCSISGCTRSLRDDLDPR